jgi:Holliday junction resolvasome RuvABC ATP-dependent DNA helicase subunit
MLEILTTNFCKKCNSSFQQAEEVTGELCLDCQFPKEEKNKAQDIVLTPALLDTSKLSESQESKEFRPMNWDEYVGQTFAKEKVKSYIIGCKKFGDVYPHTFISAPSGMGKTLFSTILANQLNKKIIFTTGGELKAEQIFIDKLVESDGGVIFIDESNRLSKRVGFYILPLMEQFEVEGQAVKKFTLIFSTTHKGDISKDLDALIQRCDQINLEPYSDNEMINIVEQYRKKQYPSVQIPDNVKIEIVKSCRNIPRNAKNLVRAYAYNQDWNTIKRFSGIIKDGLNVLDIQTLQYLESNNGAGASSIANHLRIKPQTYLYDVEPFLIFKNYIKIENKRVLTNEGIKFLKDL